MRIKRFFMVVLGCLICALAFNVFFSPYHIMPGGVSGIAIILKRIFDLDESVTVLLLSIMLLLISLIFLGSKATLKSVIGSILFPVFIYLTNLFLVYIDLNIYNKLLASLVGGVMFGLGIGLVYKEGYTTGGSDILSKIIYKYLHISLGNATLIIDGIITIVGTFVFGFETLIYSLITIYMISIMIDKVMLGLFGNKSFYIITSNPSKIKDFIIKDLGHGATIIDGKGAYSNEDKSIILAVIPSSDYYKLKDKLKELDNNAFFVVCNSYEVGGGK